MSLYIFSPRVPMIKELATRNFFESQGIDSFCKGAMAGEGPLLKPVVGFPMFDTHQNIQYLGDFLVKNLDQKETL